MNRQKRNKHHRKHTQQYKTTILIKPKMKIYQPSQKTDSLALHHYQTKRITSINYPTIPASLDNVQPSNCNTIIPYVRHVDFLRQTQTSTKLAQKSTVEVPQPTAPRTHKDIKQMGRATSTTSIREQVTK